MNNKKVKTQSNWNLFSKAKLLAKIKNFDKKKLLVKETANRENAIILRKRVINISKSSNHILNIKKSKKELVFVKKNESYTELTDKKAYALKFLM